MRFDYSTVHINPIGVPFVQRDDGEWFQLRVAVYREVAEAERKAAEETERRIIDEQKELILERAENELQRGPRIISDSEVTQILDAKIEGVSVRIMRNCSRELYEITGEKDPCVALAKLLQHAERMQRLASKTLQAIYPK